MAPVARREHWVDEPEPDPFGRGLDVGGVGECRALLHGGGLQCRLEIRQGLCPRPVVGMDPAVGDVVDRRRVQVVQPLPSLADGRDQVGGLEHIEVLGHGLAGHAHVEAELAQAETVVVVQPVEQHAAAGVAQGPEHGVLRDFTVLDLGLGHRPAPGFSPGSGSLSGLARASRSCCGGPVLVRFAGSVGSRFCSDLWSYVMQPCDCICQLSS